MKGGTQLRSIAAYSALALAAAVAAYFSLFVQFAPQDDEGTLLVSLASFLDGDPLYRDVYSPYGPFYFEFFGAVFGAAGIPVETDSGRIASLVIWVAAAILLGLVAHRATGRLSLGAIGAVAAFASLRVLGGESMHPQGLCILLLAVFALVAVGGGGRPRAAGGACGALVAALLLTKLNLGAFAIAAVALAAVLACPPLTRAPLRLPVVAGFLALPLLVVARDVAVGWAREVVLLEALAAAALLCAAWRRGDAREEAGATVPWLVAFAAGFAAAAVAILLVAVITGPSPADLYDGIVREAMRVRDVLILPLHVPRSAVYLSVLAVGVALAARRLRGAEGEGPALALAVLRGGAGVAILLAAAASIPLGLTLSAASDPVVIPLLLAWVAALPPRGGDEGAYRRFIRVLLPALAIAETLQAYPVAGSQVRIAAALFVPVALICLDDALRDLEAWAAGSPSRRRLLHPAVGAALLALVGGLALKSSAGNLSDNVRAYRDNEALPFAGADLVRLPAQDAETYTNLVELLERHRCTDFVAYPNVNSLYLWSGIEPPPPSAPGAWIEALDAEAQQRVVDALRRSPRPCAIRNDGLAEAWLSGEPPPERPLVRHIREGFVPVDQAGAFEFMLPPPPPGGPGRP